jgi:endonuclease YncB( thermonuclease family)
VTRSIKYLPFYVSKPRFQVSQVYLAPRVLPGFLFYGKNLPAEMLKAGWALTYEQVRFLLLL